MVGLYEVIGYIILGPWEDERIKLTMGLSTISAGAGEAWRKHTRNDMSKVQAWFDKGYRLRKVNIELINESPDS
jgi:hypothetical protein